MGAHTRTCIWAVTRLDVTQADVERVVAIAREMLRGARTGDS